jgi:hypothetical protein
VSARGHPSHSPAGDSLSPAPLLPAKIITTEHSRRIGCHLIHDLHPEAASVELRFSRQALLGAAGD